MVYPTIISVWVIFSSLLFGLKKRAIFFSYTALFCVVYFSSYFILPEYDHAHFLSKAAGYSDLSVAFFSNDLSVAPISPLIRIVSAYCFIDLESAALLLNALFFTLSSFHLHWIFFRCSPSVASFVGFFILSFSLFPSGFFLLRSANKDLALSFFFTAFLFFLQKFSSSLGGGRVSSRTKQIYYLVLSASSLFLVFQLRSYFFRFILAALSLVIFFLFLKRIYVSRRLQMVFLILMAYILCSFVLFSFWEDIRVLGYTYEGNAVIFPLFHFAKPDGISFFCYPMISLFLFFFYPISMIFNNQSISGINIIAGLLEGLSFIGGTFLFLRIFFICEKFCTISTVILLCFFFIQFMIQPWGSPNVGSLFRLFFCAGISFSWVIYLYIVNSFRFFLQHQREKKHGDRSV